ncbi:MAG: serine/threonine protein kinase [Labilithrix sp.]|nr:serine/threonine protein kinase [Labilithrix sp.]
MKFPTWIGSLTVAEAARIPQPGEIVAGKYRLLRLLGEGGMGTVLAAEHLRLRQPIAIKFLNPDMLGVAEIVERFDREARAAATLRSRHVVRVTDVEQTPEGVPYMVMELLEGADLEAERERRSRLPHAEAVDYVLQACGALVEAHDAGIVHRDLKPGNLFLAREDRDGVIVKVLDFGISKFLQGDDVKLTSAGAVMGTALYMSPEQIRGDASIDARSDIWSLGVILYELIGGEAPWMGPTTRVAAAIVSEAAPNLAARCDLPPELARAIHAMLEKDPARRLQTIAEVAAALAPFAPAGSVGAEVAEHLARRGRRGPRASFTAPTAGGPSSSPELASSPSGLGAPTMPANRAPEVRSTMAATTTSPATHVRPRALWGVLAGFVGLALAGAALIVFVARSNTPAASASAGSEAVPPPVAISAEPGPAAPAPVPSTPESPPAAAIPAEPPPDPPAATSAAATAVAARAGGAARVERAQGARGAHRREQRARADGDVGRDAPGEARRDLVACRQSSLSQVSIVSPKRFVPVLAVLAPVAITAACYGPTEVSVVVTTDLACDVGPRTAIFKGFPFDTAPDAETSECTPVADADARIGSLVFVPSGSADGRAGVKVVLARGRSTGECDAHPEDCIVATRSFSFVKHLSRRVPIRMLSECLGKRCPEGQTCGAGGVCVSDAVTCESDDCGLDGGGAPDAADVVVDAGDADVGATLPRVPCRGPSGDGVLAVSSGSVVAAALTTTEHYFIEGVQNRLMLLPKSGGVPVDTDVNGGRGGGVVALTTIGPHWAALVDTGVGPSRYVLRSSAVAKPLELGALAPPRAAVATLEAGMPVAYVALAGSVQRVTLAAMPVVTQFFDLGADAVAVDPVAVYLGRDDGVTAVQTADGKDVAVLPLLPPAGRRVLFASNGPTVLAAGLRGTKPTIERLNGTQPPTSIATMSTVVTSLAADVSHVYWTDGSSVRRRPLAGIQLAIDEPVYTPTIDSTQVDHVLVDASCVYVWETGGFAAQTVLRGFAKAGAPPDR